MIEALDGFPETVVALRGSGSVSAADYHRELMPRIEAAFAVLGKVRVYLELGPDFTDFEPGALWADFKLGVEHLLGWEKVALVTDVSWLAHSTQFFGVMIPGDVRVFALDEADEAKRWVSA